MTKTTRCYRFALLAMTGGCLLQLAGCIGGLAPVLLSVAESAALSALFGGFAL